MWGNVLEASKWSVVGKETVKDCRLSVQEPSWMSFFFFFRPLKEGHAQELIASADAFSMQVLYMYAKPLAR